MAGAAATIAAAAPWGGSADHKATLRGLAKSIEVSKGPADSPAGFSRSADLPANVVMDDRLALDYLAEQGEVCAVINKTCCTL